MDFVNRVSGRIGAGRPFMPCFNPIRVFDFLFHFVKSIILFKGSQPVLAPPLQCDYVGAPYTC